MKNKKAITQMKALFLIANMMIAMIAFSWMVSAAEAGVVQSLGSETATNFNIGPTNVPIESGVSSAGGLTTAGNVAGATGTTATTGGTQVVGPNLFGKINGIFSGGIITSFFWIAAFAGGGYLLGGLLGGNGAKAGLWAGLIGATTYQLLANPANFGLAAKGTVFQPLGLAPMGWGIAAAAIVFLVMYKKTSTEIVEFNCLPYQPPIGGDDCQLCNDIENGCSEYRCKSLGQACELVNKGTTDEKCIWKNPRDVNSPILEMTDVLEGYTWKPDTSIRPPATGVVITQKNGEDVEPFTALEFTITSSEPAQCKIDYNLTKGFEEMAYYVGGTNLFSYNHSEKMALPSPNAINAIDPELKNDGTYTLYVRCRDANGNFNQDVYSVRFKVKEGPDATPPKIINLNVPSDSPINYNRSTLDLEVYVNEPSECKWSREDKDYNLMENTMSCATNLWEMNNENVYTCKTTLTGLQSKTDNDYYFRCKDQPGANEADRNVNTQSYLYTLIGTQPLNILEIKPEKNEIVKGATETIPVFLQIKTDNGFRNGESVCYYSLTQNEKDYIKFANTTKSSHSQRQNLISGTYTYYFKCVDLGGNSVYNSTTFEVESDNNAPTIVRAYKEEGQLKIIANEESECAYSNKDCNFEIKEGLKMNTMDKKSHAIDWVINKNYYIRCKDGYGNEPNIQVGANGCSIVLRPYQIEAKSNAIDLSVA